MGQTCWRSLIFTLMLLHSQQQSMVEILVLRLWYCGNHSVTHAVTSCDRHQRIECIYIKLVTYA